MILAEFLLFILIIPLFFSNFTALHWAAAHGQPDVITYLLFVQADFMAKSKDGNTPLHLAAMKHMLNAAHLLVDAGADVNAVNEARERPVDVCGDDQPMIALLSGIKTRSLDEEPSNNDNVLNAAKNLLSSTLTPVSAEEEKIVLSCQKVINEANKLQRAPVEHYKDTKLCLQKYSVINGEFKVAFSNVSQYREKLNSSSQSVSTMSQTLEENEKTIRNRMQRGRTANCQTRNQARNVDDKLIELSEEKISLEQKIAETEKALAEIKQRKLDVEDQIHNLEEQKAHLTRADETETKDETYLAEHQESLQNTRTLIGQGVDSLKELDRNTSDRMLNTGLEYAKFLRSYHAYTKQLLANLDSKIVTMNERIETQTKNIEEIPKLELNLNPEKIQQLEHEYKLNLDKFERRKVKATQLLKTIEDDYNLIKDDISKFGRELDPIE